MSGGTKRSGSEGNTNRGIAGEVERFFAEDGPLARAKPGYKRRPSQVELALATLRSLQEGEPLLADAPPGSGKSLGYLVPAAIWAVKSRESVVVSTATIALQSQLLEEDLPALAGAMRASGYRSPGYALAKGRSNFLCEARLENALGGDGSDGSSGGSGVGQMHGTRALTETPSLFGVSEKAPDRGLLDEETLDNLGLFLHTAETGDKEEVFFPITPAQWREVAADGDDCAPRECPFRESCFYFKHVDAARDAEIMVVNHALYFASLLGKGPLNLLGRHVILDEAHRVEETLRESQSIRVTEGRVKYVARAVRKRSKRLANASRKLEDAGAEFFSNLALRAAEIDPKTLLAGGIGKPPAGYDALLAALRKVVGAAGESDDKEVQGCKAMAESLIRDLGSFYGKGRTGDIEAAPQQISTLERSQTIEVDGGQRAALRSWPIEVGGIFTSKVLERGEASSEDIERTPATILTSATLATGSSDKGGDPFRHAESCLFEGASDGESCKHTPRKLKLPEGFDHDRNSLLYLEQDLPAPSYGAGAASEARHYDRLAERVQELVRASEGRALVLCSSNKSVAALKERLGETIPLDEATEYSEKETSAPSSDISVSYQHDASVTALVWWLKNSPNAVLVGTRTFWEGVDVRGDALSMVIIEKVPFPSPSDPVIAALSERAGKRWFSEISLPRAQITLRQGAGRLLRAESDHGVVAILDTRVANKPWGKALLSALPQEAHTSEVEKVRNFLRDWRSAEADVEHGPSTKREAGDAVQNRGHNDIGGQ